MSAQSETINIDFGVNATTTGSWNNLTANYLGSSVSNLVNSSAASTGIGISITDTFTGNNEVGTSEFSATLNYPSTATSDTFYGSGTDGGSLLFSNLVIGKEYTITLFASRSGVSGNRQATYTVVGATTQAVNLDAAENKDNSVFITFKPKSDGTAVLNVTKGPDNTVGLFYLGIVQLQYLTAAPTYSNNALFVDFGSSTKQSTSNWNNLTNALTTGSLTNILNKGGVATNVNLAVTDSFNYINEFGTSSPGLSLGIPSTATSDSFFGNSVVFEGKTEPTGAVKYTNFDPNSDLSLTFYASRVEYGATDNRETKYSIEGLTTEIVYLNAINNVNNSVSTLIKPKADGSLTITVSKGPNNTNASGFFYLGAMIIDYTSAPSLTINSPNSQEFWQVGKTTNITWSSVNLISNVVLQYSTDNGANWNLITTVPSTTKSYAWIVPNSVSKNCLVRATSNDVQDSSDGVFEISGDNSSCNIVVLGSSTAEGTGASTLAKSWVSLFAEAIYQKNTRLNVINLGKGGYTTYHILPTGTSIPSGVGVSIDTERNITKALSYSPIAIIVNMPSNDTNNGYPVADQLANFATNYNKAASSSVPMWIATTQPRNFGVPAKIQDQIDVREGIINTYGAKAINFWADIAETDGTIMSSLNSGDGVHLNDAGHAILYNKVLAANIQDLQCNPSSTLSISQFINEDFAVYTYPNPIKEELNIRFNTTSNGIFTLELFDILGKQILVKSSNFDSGNNTKTFLVGNLKPQVLLGKVQFKKSSGEVEQRQFKIIVE